MTGGFEALLTIAAAFAVLAAVAWLVAQTLQRKDDEDDDDDDWWVW